MIDTVDGADEPAPARVSFDPALTAFAQLGAHKLQCERSFISIIDQETQYIIAEATRSVSLLTEERHEAGDGLYLGLRALPVDFGVCPTAIKIFSDPNFRPVFATSNMVANSSRYIIHDFWKEPTFQGHPYVTGWPYFRFYAEVPLKNPNGYVIGSYCVVDNKPREYFSDSEVQVLAEVAMVIMNHLELSRMKQDQHRAERLMQGLVSVVEGDPRAGPSETTLTRSEPKLPVGANPDHDFTTRDSRIRLRYNENSLQVQSLVLRLLFQTLLRLDQSLKQRLLHPCARIIMGWIFRISEDQRQRAGVVR